VEVTGRNNKTSRHTYPTTDDYITEQEQEHKTIKLAEMSKIQYTTLCLFV